MQTRRRVLASEEPDREPTPDEQFRAVMENPGKRLISFLADEEVYHFLQLNAIQHGYSDWKVYLNDLLRHDLL